MPHPEAGKLSARSTEIPNENPRSHSRRILRTRSGIHTDWICPGPARNQGHTNRAAPRQRAGPEFYRVHPDRAAL